MRGREKACGRNDCVTGRAAADFLTRGQYIRTPGGVNSAVNAEASKELLIGCVNDGVYGKGRDVSLPEVNLSAFISSEPEQGLDPGLVPLN